MTANPHTDSYRPVSSVSGVAAGQGHLPVIVVIFLITLLLPISFNLGSLRLMPARAFLMLAFLPLMMALLSGKAGRLIATDYFFAVFLFWGTVSIAVNNPNRVVEQMGSFGIELLGGYMLGRVAIRTPEAFIALIKAVAIVIIVTLPFALYEAMTGTPILLEVLRSAGLNALKDMQMEPRMGLDRAQVMMVHPIHYGLFCASAFGLVLVGLKGSMGNTKRFLLAGLVFLGVFLSLSSGALLSVILQIGLLMWAVAFDWSKNRWIILVSILAALYVAIDLASNRTPIRVFMSYATFSAHNAFWRGIIFEWGMVNVWRSPIFGIGLNNWVRPHFMSSASVDNFWLVMAMRHGIPGFILIATGFFLIIWEVGRAKFKEYSTVWWLRRAWVFAFCGTAFSLATVHIWSVILSFVFFLLGAGAWLITYEEPETDDDGDAVPAEARAGAPSYRREAAPTRSITPHSSAGRAAAPASRREDDTVQNLPYTRFRATPAASGALKPKSRSKT